MHALKLTYCPVTGRSSEFWDWWKGGFCPGFHGMKTSESGHREVYQVKSARSVDPVGN